MRSIKLVYWNGKNLGDYLSPFIISKLSGLPIKYKSLCLFDKKAQLNLLFDYFIKKILLGRNLQKLYSFLKEMS